MEPSTDADVADVIVGGGGGAGCVIAARLAEALPNLDVLLVEKGADNRSAPRLAQPLDSLFWRFQQNPYLHWLESEPQEELGGRKPRVPVGTVLGGGMSVNTLIYNTPAASDFDDWNQPGWSYEDLRPHIAKSIHHLDSKESFSVEADRALGVSSGGHQLDFGSAIHQAFNGVTDIPMIEGFTDYHTAHGVGRWPKLIDEKGGRSSAADKYLHQSTSPNLQILTQTTVSRVLLHQHRAIGIQTCRDDGTGAFTTRDIMARKMVILCCGALGTPGILERSGIGDPEVLTDAGIELQVDLPGVGAELDDHQTTNAVYYSREVLSEFDDYARGTAGVKESADREWKMTGKGLGATNGFDWGYKVRPDDQEIASMGSDFETHWRHRIGNNTDKSLYQSFFIPYYYFYSPAPRPDGAFFSIGAYHSYPASRGSIHITSSNPFAPPKLNVGMLEHPADLPVHVWHYKLQREVARRLPFFAGEYPDSHPVFPPGSAASLHPVSDPNPPLSSTGKIEKIQYRAEDDRAIEEWVRRTIDTAYHSTTTCPMRSKEEAGVVDCRLNVHGVKGLKVADLSICPSNVGSNTTSVVLVIAEKTVELIVEDLQR